MSNPNPENKVSEATKLVSVGCKLPHGLVLSLTTGGGDVISHTLKGMNAKRIVGGHGITENIPADFMMMWLEKNARHPAVKNGSIFIHSHTKSAEAMARERVKNQSGLEPIDPIKNGMLKNENGDLDKAAVAVYNKARESNPDRNRQQVE